MREEEEGLVHRHHPKKLRKGKGSPVPPPRHQSSYGRFAEPQGHPSPIHTDPSDQPTAADHPPPEGHRVLNGARELYHTIAGDDEEAQLQRRFRQDVATKLPSDAYDLVVQDKLAEEEEMVRDRRRGEPGSARKKIFRQTYPAAAGTPATRGEDAPPATRTEITDIPGHKVEVKDTFSVAPSEGSAEVEEVVRIRVQEEVQTAKEVAPPLTSDSTNPWSRDVSLL